MCIMRLFTDGRGLGPVLAGNLWHGWIWALGLGTILLTVISRVLMGWWQPASAFYSGSGSARNAGTQEGKKERERGRE